MSKVKLFVKTDKQIRLLPKDAFYKASEKLRSDIAEFMGTHKITDLSKKDLLSLLSLCSSYRPVEPYRALLQISMELEQGQ